MHETARIDASDDARFWRSYSSLRKSLTPNESVRFAIAIQHILGLTLDAATPVTGSEVPPIEAA